MAQKMTGALVFDERTDRYDIRFDLNSYYGGLHCGECFDVFVRGKRFDFALLNIFREYSEKQAVIASACPALKNNRYLSGPVL